LSGFLFAQSLYDLHRPCTNAGAAQGTNSSMDRLSIAFAVLIAVAVALDITLNHSTASLFLARKFMDLIALVAFWR